MTSDLYSFENLWRQYRACRRNKRNTINQLRFEIDAEANLLELQRELREHAYRPGRSICFVTDGAKPREVFAAAFRDRVVHHLLVSRLEPVFEPRFVHDSYACRKGKGVLAASDRLMQFLRQTTANGRRPGWALKLDIASFFTSIDKGTLYAIIARQVRNPEILWLTRVILFHDPTAESHFKPGPRHVAPPHSGGYPIPVQKSLFGKNNERGLPIGNLTSQFWANVYLNELDQFVKRQLRCRRYVRYVDDLVLLAQEPETLRRWREEVAAFAAARLKLRLREPNAEPAPAGGGIDFIGWKTFWNHRRPRGRTLASCAQRLRRFEKRALRPLCNGAAYRIEVGMDDCSLRHCRRGRRGTAAPPRPASRRSALQKLHSVLASYSGHLRHGAARRAWAEIWRAHGWLGSLFVREAHEPWRIRARWPGRTLLEPRFSRQYARLIRHGGDRALVFCQVGRFVEFYGPQREAATRALGLVRVKIARGGFGFSVGFPVRLGAAYVSRISCLHYLSIS